MSLAASTFRVSTGGLYLERKTTFPGAAMSRIFEALRQAEFATAKRQNSFASRGCTAEEDDRRRTPRTRVQIPLSVYGIRPGGNPFYEEARTIAINAHGGLISLKTVLQPGQRLLVVTKTKVERVQECRVVFVGARLAGSVDVAFEFLTQAPHFWCDL